VLETSGTLLLSSSQGVLDASGGGPPYPLEIAGVSEDEGTSYPACVLSELDDRTIGDLGDDLQKTA
jgi:hypothetical protein